MCPWEMAWPCLTDMARRPSSFTICHGGAPLAPEIFGLETRIRGLGLLPPWSVLLARKFFQVSIPEKSKFPLPGVMGPGSKISHPAKFLLSCLPQERNLTGIKLGKSGPQNHFCKEPTKAAA